VDQAIAPGDIGLGPNMFATDPVVANQGLFVRAYGSPLDVFLFQFDGWRTEAEVGG
jgi:hypothetical protein